MTPEIVSPKNIVVTEIRKFLKSDKEIAKEIQKVTNSDKADKMYLKSNKTIIQNQAEQFMINMTKRIILLLGKIMKRTKHHLMI